MTPDEFLELLKGDNAILKQRVLEWMQVRTFEVRGAVYELPAKVEITMT